MLHANKILKVFVVIFATVFIAGPVLSQVPKRVSFQGALTDNQGKLQPNGDYQVTFALYAAETGGSAVWTSPSKTVTVVNGLFNYIIGSDPGVPSFGSVNLHRPLWLEVRLGGLPLPTRFEISSGLYSLAADSARTAGTASVAGNGVPVGTVLAFAGSFDKIPKKWLPCDGRALSMNVFRDLYDVLQTSYGTSDTLFRIPDLRGRFLRGVDSTRLQSGEGAGVLLVQDAKNDPDRDKRAADTAGLGGKYVNANKGNSVGSIQIDDLMKHAHKTWTPYSYGGVGFSNGGYDFGIVYRPSTGTRFDSDPAGGTETRPKNIAIIYIIKALP